MSNVAINIAAEFTGKAAFTKAGKSVSGLEKSVNGLAKKFIGLFAAQKLYSYGKASVKAFSEDQAAATRLSNAIDNLGLSYSKVRAADFIADLEKTAGIADDVLRPAFQALLTTTGSLTKSQELLNNAIQISRASGVELGTVAQDLANGYVGITKGLKKYNIGLTQSELKTKSFSEVLGLLLTRSAGAAEAYLDTTAYKMNVLSVAAGNASEKIGAGLVDAFAKAAGGSSAADAAKAFDTIADAINGISGAIGGTIGLFTKFVKKVDEFTYNFDPIIGDSKASMDARKKFTSGRQSSPAGSWARTKQQREAEALAAKRAKELAALQRKQLDAQKKLTAEQKKQATLKKAGSIFDMEQIQLIAALKGNLSMEEQKRVLLQFALLTNNVSEAQRLTKEIALAQGLGQKLADDLSNINPAPNPFAAWEAYLDIIIEKARLAASAGGGGGGGGGAGGSIGGNVTTKVTGKDFSGFALPTTTPGTSGSASQYGGSTPWAQAAANSIYVQLDGKTIASALMDQSLSGNQSYVNRRTGGFD